MNLNKLKCNLWEILLDSIQTYFSDELRKYTLIPRSLMDLWHMGTNILSKHVFVFLFTNLKLLKESSTV